MAKTPDNPVSPTMVSSDADWLRSSGGSGPPYPPLSDDPAPTTFGRFQLLGQLGAGGMGVVYRALDTASGQVLALKVIRGDSAISRERRARLLREARAMARLSHPGVVQLFEVGEEDQRPYFTMRLIDGPTLAARLDGGRLPVEEALRLGVALARVLAYAHREGLIHRDVKPGNVMLEGGREPVLLDFGLVQEPDAETTRYTRDSQLLGTPMYMAPELALEGPSAAGPASDQYAAALVVWEMLTGRHPFQAPTQLAVLQRAISENPPSLRVYGISSALDTVLRRALSRDPAARFADMEAFARALEGAGAGEEPAAPPPPAEPPSRPPTPGWSREAEPRPVPSADTPTSGGRVSWALPQLGVVLLLLAAALLSRSGFWQRREVERAAEARRQEMMARVGPRVAGRDWAGSEREFLAFAEDPKNQDSRALARAWMDWSGVQLAAGRQAEALDALAHAYANAEPANLSDPLAALARRFWETADWDRLEATLGVIQRRAPALLQDPEIARYSEDLRVYHGELGALGPDRAPELRALARALEGATVVGQVSQLAFPWQARAGTPGLALVGRDQPFLRLLRADLPGLPEIQRVDVPMEIIKFPVPVRGMSEATPLLFADNADRCEVRFLEGDALVSRGSFDCTIVRNAVQDPVTRDLLVSDNRRLWLLEQGPDGQYHARSAERSTNASNSEVWGLEFVDTDGDGEEEFWVTTSVWGSFDVRILERTGDGYRLAQRRRMGKVTGLAPLEYGGGRAVVVVQTHDPRYRIDAHTFGPEGPYGEEQGLHVLRRTPTELERLAHLPLPAFLFKARGRDSRHTTDIDYQIQSGDLTGDGQSEIILSVADSATFIYTPRAGGGFERLALDGYMPMALLEVDGDPAKELLIRSADTALQLVLLGVGAEALRAPTPAPASPLGQIADESPPENRDPSLRQRWRLAADLVTLGFPAVAAARFERLGRDAPETQLGVAALSRAASLYEALGRADDAAALLSEVASDPAASSEALEEAFEVLYAARRMDEAERIGLRRLARPDPPASVEAGVGRIRLAREAPRAALLFDGAELPPIEIGDAAGISHVPGEGLVHRFAGLSQLWSLPMAYDGGPVGIQLDLTPGRIDWGHGLRFSVGRDADHTEITQFMLVSGGGGGYTHYRVKCPGQAGGWGLEPAEVEGARLEAIWEYDPQTGGGSCTLRMNGEEIRRTVFQTPSFPLPERFSFEVLAGSDALGVSEATLRALTFVGLRPLQAEEDALGPARRAQVIGPPEAARAAWEALSRGADPGAARGADLVARLFLAHRLSRSAERDALLAELLRRDPEARADLGRVLVMAPEALFPALLARLGDRAYRLQFNAMQLALDTGDHREEVRRSFVRIFSGVSALPQRSLESHPDFVSILAKLGATLRRMGDPGAAGEALSRAIGVGQAMRAGQPEAELERTLAFAAREQAALRLEAGQPDEAMRWLLEAIAAHPAPELFADQCAATAEFAPLRTHPRWSEIERARTGGAPKP